MRFLALITVGLAMAGCASQPLAVSPASGRSEKEQVAEIDVLHGEIGVIVLNLGSLQKDLAARSKDSLDAPIYPLEDRERDLDNIIKMLRETRDRLAAEDKRLRLLYHVEHGPY